MFHQKLPGNDSRAYISRSVRDHSQIRYIIHFYIQNHYEGCDKTAILEREMTYLEFCIPTLKRNQSFNQSYLSEGVSGFYREDLLLMRVDNQGNEFPHVDVTNRTTLDYGDFEIGNSVVIDWFRKNRWSKLDEIYPDLKKVLFFPL